MIKGWVKRLFAAERHKIIKQYLKSNKQLEVTAISAMLGVSEVTIRRDLETLERAGFLTRTHGGAILHHGEAEPEAPLPQAPALSAFDQQIVQTGVSLIQNGDVVLLCSSPLTRELAKALAASSLTLTVLTNDLVIAQCLGRSANTNTVLLGGQLDAEGTASYGVLTLANLQYFFVNKVFFEPDGMNSDLIMTSSSTGKAEFIQKAFSISKEKILLFPSGIQNQTAFFRIGELPELSIIISDPGIGNPYKEQFFKRNFRLYTSLSLYDFSVPDSVT